MRIQEGAIEVSELVLASLLCGFLSGGETEIRHYFPNVGKTRQLRIDCETPTHVIEVGLDNSSSNRDSIHQAVFASFLTDKIPLVILIDTDGFEGRYEYEMRQVTALLGVGFSRCSQGIIERWAATSSFRIAGSDKTLDDLPKNVTVTATCDVLDRLSD